MELTRRDMVKLSMLGTAAVALPLERAMGGPATLANRIAQSALPAPFTIPFTPPPLLAPVRTDATTDYFRVSMEPAVVSIIPGLQTMVWGYNGSVPGPTFRVARGRRSVVRQINNLPARHPVLDYAPWTSVHLHGSASLPQYDGYASDITNPGQWKDYIYPNRQPARTLWYHDHGVHHTAQNVFMGLAGMYIMTDPVEQSLPIPHGGYDVPLIVSDMMFNTDGSLLFHLTEDSGFYGDVIAVNGRPWPLMKVARRKYRFRILNASVARSYRWSLSDGSPLTVIATDAGLMAAPKKVSSLRQAPAERYEVVIDFARYQPGARIVLRNSSPRNNVNYINVDKVMAFQVTDDPFDPADNEVPAVLEPYQPTMALTASQSVRTRRLTFGRDGGEWVINNRTWEDVVRSGFSFTLATPRRDEVEIWELRNPSGGWHHPIHIHFVDFKILSRNGRPCEQYETGPKDTVFLGENETVRILVKFDGGSGKYMIHCHNLVHEDHDMMGQFEIVDDTTAAADPFSAPARPLPETYL